MAQRGEVFGKGGRLIVAKGKKSEKASQGDGARVALANAYVRAAKRIEACAQGLHGEPDDAEALHQYRISLRVARSLVRFARPYQKKSQREELEEALKRLQAPTSRVRELDMLVKQLSAAERAEAPTMTGYRSATNAGAVALAGDSDILVQCRQVQAEARAAFMESFGKRKTVKRLDRVQELLAHPKWSSAGQRELKSKRLRKRVEAERLSCDETLSDIDVRDQEAVHAIRKRAKALRYVTRELSACLPSDSTQTSQDMKAVQDKLGDMLDARVNAQLLRQICGEAGEERARMFDQRADAIADEMA